MNYMRNIFFNAIKIVDAGPDMDLYSYELKKKKKYLNKVKLSYYILCTYIFHASK